MKSTGGPGGYLDVPTLLTVSEVAVRLNVTEQRVYQMDEELTPVKQARGAKTVTRYYDPDVVERVRAEREADERKPPHRERLVVSRLHTAAHKAGMRIDMSVADLGALSAGACAFCGAEADPRHDIIRLDDGGPFSSVNLSPCCRSCMNMKGDSSALEFVQRALRIARWSCGLDVT